MGLVITGVVTGMCWYYTGIDKKIQENGTELIMQSCNDSKQCRAYFNNPPEPPSVAGISGATNYTPQSWAVELLKRGGWPQTTSNIDTVVAWEYAEGGHWQNSASFNPLNTTQTEPGSREMAPNSGGVQAYASWDQGFQATLTTLGYSPYGEIRRQLQAGNCGSCLISAIVASPWAASHYGGHL